MACGELGGHGDRGDAGAGVVHAQLGQTIQEPGRQSRGIEAAPVGPDDLRLHPDPGRQRGQGSGQVRRARDGVVR